MKVCHLAEAADLAVSPHVSPELSTTVAAAVTNSIFVEFIPQMEPVLARPLRVVAGHAIPSDAPGHGIELDEAALERFEVQHEPDSHARDCSAHAPAVPRRRRARARRRAA